MGHSQARAAELIGKSAGGQSVLDQSVISRWESGSTSRPSEIHIEAIRAYCEANAPELSPRSAITSTPEAGSTDSDLGFEGIVRGITGEPLLGANQAALVAGLIERLSKGPAMAREEVELARDLMNILRVS